MSTPAPLCWYYLVFSDNDFLEITGPNWPEFLLGIQKYVYLAVLQTPVFPLKPQKEVYFFLGHPVPGSGIGMNHQPGIDIGMNYQSGIGIGMIPILGTG